MNALGRSIRGLDYVSFFLANVRDGLGPYLAIYLLANKHWNPYEIGIAMSVPGIVRILVQSPAGYLIDKTLLKRFLIIVSSLTVGLCCISILFFPSYYVVIFCQAVIGLVTSLYTPTIAAITLGIVGYDMLARRIGRNESFNHLGNVITALAAGLIGHYYSYEGIFYLITFSCIASSLSVLAIQEKHIDHKMARAARDGEEHSVTPVPASRVLLDRNIFLFAMAVTLFGVANGSMLSLAGQKMQTDDPSTACLGMSGCIVAAQVVMMFIARITGDIAERGNRKYLFLLSFTMVPLRGYLYTLSDDPVFTICIQILDGIGGGIFGVLSIIMIADLTEGTGRFNFVQGVITALIGIGTASSAYISGFVADVYNYNQAFICLAVIGGFACFYVLFFVPETRNINRDPGGIDLQSESIKSEDR